MLALPSSILEPLWVQAAALLPVRQVDHPLGCHRPRIPDRIVFDKLIQLLLFGCGYRRIADHTCSASTLRRRRDEWINAGIAEQLRQAVLIAYDRMLGLELLAVDGCTTKAPCGGQVAGPSPANHCDDGLLVATLDATRVVGPLPARPVVHLDAGYDYQPCRQVLAERGMVGQIATRGVPAPVQAGRRWVIERTHAWGNQYGKLRRRTERRRLVVEFWLVLVGAVDAAPAWEVRMSDGHQPPGRRWVLWRGAVLASRYPKMAARRVRTGVLAVTTSGHSSAILHSKNRQLCKGFDMTAEQTTSGVDATRPPFDQAAAVTRSCSAPESSPACAT